MDFELLRSATDQGMTIRQIAADAEVSYTTVRYWLKKYGLKTQGSQHISSSWDPEFVRSLALSSSSVGEMLVRLNLGQSSGEYKSLHNYADRNGITLPPPANRGNGTGRIVLTDDEFFVFGVRREGRGLRDRLVRLGREYICECGQLPTWQGRPLVLQVDHIDGDSYNNLKSNLRFLCPNCHTQTDTFGRKIRPVIPKKRAS